MAMPRVAFIGAGVHRGGVTTWRSWAAVAVIAGEPAAGTRAVVGEAALSWANVRTHTGPREAWGGWERSRRSSPTRLQWRLREEDGDVETKAVGPPGSEARRGPTRQRARAQTRVRGWAGLSARKRAAEWAVRAGKEVGPKEIGPKPRLRF